jgi:hypothetical protein
MIIFFVFTTLNANLFNDDAKQKKQELKEKREIHKAFQKNVSDANAILKRGEYTKITKYESDLAVIMQQIKTLNIPNKNKEELQKDLTEYATLIHDINIHLQAKAPKLGENHLNILRQLDTFNNKIATIGLSELSENWRKLSNIKNDFVKHPSAKMEKEFNAKWSAVVVTINELYLDEEIETPLLDYLNDYKTYFQELNNAYSSAQYASLNKVKPLSYKIKAELELLVPYN